jgi:hypothetical protein
MMHENSNIKFMRCPFSGGKRLGAGAEIKKKEYGCT